MNTQYYGKLTLSNKGEENQFRRISLFSSIETDSEESLLGMQEVDPVMGTDYFHNPNTGFEPLDIETASARLILQYQDGLLKTIPLKSAYQVTVMVAYVEKHPEIEALADPLERKLAYERAIRDSVFSTSR